MEPSNLTLEEQQEVERRVAKFYDVYQKAPFEIK
jgi:hypothetical protein